jgi:hypothetical protein
MVVDQAENRNPLSFKGLQQVSKEIFHPPLIRRIIFAHMENSHT